MTFSPTFQAPFSKTFAKTLSASASWWLAGGNIVTDVMVAYQSKGAASYAASKSNLANPGTNDAVDGTAYPTWDTATGWTGNGTNQFLTIGSITTGYASFAIRFSGATSAGLKCVLGNYVGAFFYVIPNYAGQVFYGYGNELQKAPAHTSGTLILTNQKAYRDGADESLAFNAFIVSGPNALTLLSYGGTQWFSDANILAFAMYNTTIPDPLALHTAMAAL